MSTEHVFGAFACHPYFVFVRLPGSLILFLCFCCSCLFLFCQTAFTDEENTV